jgi:hypothetical protein
MSINELVEETALDNGDPVLTTEEGERYSNKVLRRMAAEANTDAISGRDVQLEWYSYFCRQRTLNDYAKD